MSVQCVECDKFIQGRTEEPVCKLCEDIIDELEKEEPEEIKLKCYRRVNQDHQCEEWFESKTKSAIKRRNQLRKHGYGASIYNLGYTTVGEKTFSVTLVLSTPGEHDDTKGIPISNLELVDG